MASAKSLNDLFVTYKKWVVSNPDRATDMETVIKYLSYLIAGKVNKSPMISELLYSLSNLFTLYNDMLIRKAHSGNAPYGNSVRDRLKLFLTVLHYCEVFVEITSRDRWGTRGKWSAATAIQILRCVLNLVLIQNYDEVPLLQPAIPTLHRNKIAEDEIPEEYNQVGFVLKRSGRVVRKIEGALPVNLRDWKPVDVEIQRDSAPSAQKDNVKNKKFAEIIYAVKPLAHLGSVAYFGSESWKQWLVNLCLDLYSLRYYENIMNTLGYDQRLEINRRKLSLLLYLIRSPMYQKRSAAIISKLLNGMSNNIPLVGLICRPILQHLPDWQDTYFYMWPN